MQDRFKFRFWITYFDDDINKNESVMQYSDNLDSENSGSYLFYNDEDVVIQQCTGLKDCENNLIYEGDLLLVNGKRGYCNNPDMPYLVTDIEYKFEHNYPEVVIFYTNKFIRVPRDEYIRKYIKNEKCTYMHFENNNFTLNYDGVKIIGNIYENPELLEVSNG